MSGRDALTDFLATEAAHKPADCHLILVRWYEAATGARPAIALPCGDGAEAVGLYRGVVRACRALGLAETTEPQRGDVGLFRAGNAIIAGVFTGSAWVASTGRGVGVFRRFTTVKAWALA